MLLRLFALLLRLRWPVLLLLAALTAFFLWRLTGLQVGQELQGDLPADDPEVAYYEQHSARFGKAEFLLLVVEGDIWTVDGLRYLQDLSDAMSGLDGVERVTSLTTMQVVRKRLIGKPTLQPFMEALPADAEAVRALREAAAANPDMAGQLVSADGQLASVVLQLAPSGDLQTFRMAMTQRVDSALAAQGRDGYTLHLAGVGPLLRDFQVYIMRDARGLMAITMLLVLLLLAAMTRSLGGVLLPLLIIGLTVIWTMGTLAAMGKPMGMAMVMVPSLIAVICLADAIHIMSHLQHERAAEPDLRTVVPRVFAYMAGVCLLTSVTTSVGFGSLALSGQQSMRDLGLTAAVGILYGYVLSMTLLPILLAWGWLRPLPPNAAATAPRRDWLSPAFDALERLHARPRWSLVIGGLVLIGLCGALIPRLQVRTEMAGFLPPAAPAVKALDRIDGRLAGIRSLEMAVEGPVDAMSDPAALRAILAIEDRLRRIPGVDSTNSVATIVSRLHRFDAGDAAAPIPGDRDAVEQYLDMIASSRNHAMLDGLLTPDWAVARITARIGNIDSARQLEILQDIEAQAAALLPPGLSLHTTGIPKLYGARVQALVHGQKVSVVATALIAILLLVIYFRSLRVGLVALIPNILPVFVAMAAMVLLDIALNLVTMMTACIAIGLAVDDTLHILVRYLSQTRAGATPDSAIAQTLRQAGRPVLYTSIIIGVGFAVLMVSSFPPNRQFGFLAALTMFVAVLADLLVLPALIRAFRLK